MTVLEDLYYGNIVPQARSYRPGSPQKQRQEKLAVLEAQLQTTLNAESWELFRTFTNTCADCQSDIALDGFITGFRLGAQLTYEAFASDYSPLESV